MREVVVKARVVATLAAERQAANASDGGNTIGLKCRRCWWRYRQSAPAKPTAAEPAGQPTHGPCNERSESGCTAARDEPSLVSVVQQQHFGY